jgi:predicted component of type VI protein secretion system
MELVLVMFRAEGERRSFSVPRDVTVIGRREDCDLRIPVSEVSRKHCRVFKDGDEVRVEDLGSSNGTYHNGQRIMGSVAVQAGDSIEVGPVVFVVQIDGTPADDELAPITHATEEAAPAGEADDSFGDLDVAGHAGHAGTGDSLGSYSVETGEAHAGAGELGADDISVEGSHAGSAHEAPIPMSAEGDEPTLDLDLDNDHCAEGGHVLSEDELLLDLNLKDDHDKH